MRTLFRCTLFAICLLVLACSRPKPPTLTPQRVEVLSASTAGLVLRIHCIAHNPNSIPLPVRAAEGNVSLAGSPLGTFNAKSLATLAAESQAPIAFELTIPWTNVSAGLAVANAGEDVPYAVAGTAHFEAVGVKLSSTFSTTGSVKKTELANAALRNLHLPGLVPGTLPKLP